MKLTKTQLKEFKFFSFFESCPSDCAEKLNRSVINLKCYSKEDLDWMGIIALDYAEAYKANSSDCFLNGEHLEGLRWLNYSKSLDNLYCKIDSIYPSTL